MRIMSNHFKYKIRAERTISMVYGTKTYYSNYSSKTIYNDLFSFIQINKMKTLFTRVVLYSLDYCYKCYKCDYDYDYSLIIILLVLEK